MARMGFLRSLIQWESVLSKTLCQTSYLQFGLEKQEFLHHVLLSSMHRRVAHSYDTSELLKQHASQDDGGDDEYALHWMG